jgi:hypothetical protein
MYIIYDMINSLITQNSLFEYIISYIFYRYNLALLLWYTNEISFTKKLHLSIMLLKN